MSKEGMIDRKYFPKKEMFSLNQLNYMWIQIDTFNTFVSFLHICKYDFLVYYNESNTKLM